MTCILARVLWDFDLELCDDSLEWGKNQKAWVVWEKPPLNVRMRVREGTEA